MTQPLDPLKIRIWTEKNVATIDTLLSTVSLKEEVGPGLRTDRWSRLIESILVWIPIPAFYVDATSKPNFLIDGEKRLNVIKQFVVHKSFRLNGLKYYPELEGFGYDDLNINYRRRISEFMVIVHYINPGTSPENRKDIIDRISSKI